MFWLWVLAIGFAWSASPCPSLGGKAKLSGKAGERRIALLVGVGDYALTIEGDSVDLPGPGMDATRMRDLLRDDLGFPPQNLCLLTDEAATRAAVEQAWATHFEAVSGGDAVVFYFAGHGSRTSDGAHETILFHDSRVDSPELSLAELDQWLATLHDRTQNITLMLDTGHVGTERRGPLEPELGERWVPTAQASKATPPPPALVRPTLPGVVRLAAAQHGLPALERNGRGIFTTALIQAIHQRVGPTWHQVAHDIVRWVAAMHSWQRPAFSGDLDRPVFRHVPGAVGGPWTVVAVKGDGVMLEGPVLPGWAAGAVVSLASGEDPKSKVRVRLEEVSATTAHGVVVGARRKVRPGDRARLEVPGHDLTSIRVRLEADVPRRDGILAALRGNSVLQRTVFVVDGAADFVLRRGPTESVVDIVGADGVRRNRLPVYTSDQATQVARTVGLFARQAALLALSGEVPDAYPRDVFELRVLPMHGKEGCARQPYEPTERALPWARVPMCNAVQLQVKLLERPVKPLFLGILYLSGNGALHAWVSPKIMSEPGDAYTQEMGWVTPPLNTPDRLIVFGTHRPVNWTKLQADVLADVSTLRGEDESRFWVAALSGQSVRGSWMETEGGLPPWTASMVSIEVVADPSRWSMEERDATATCTRLRKAGCAANAKAE